MKLIETRYSRSTFRGTKESLLGVTSASTLQHELIHELPPQSLSLPLKLSSLRPPLTAQPASISKTKRPTQPTSSSPKPHPSHEAVSTIEDVHAHRRPLDPTNGHQRIKSQNPHQTFQCPSLPIAIIPPRSRESTPVTAKMDLVDQDLTCRVDARH